MKTEEEITKIVAKNYGTKMGVGRFPTWLNKLKMEGFRIELGKIRTFWIKDEQMVFDEPPSQMWQAVLDEVNGAEEQKPKQDVKETKQGEAMEIADRCLPAPALIPDTMTLPLIEKLKKMSTFERMLMFQNTPEDLIETRPGAGGTKLKYVKGNKMLQELNVAFLFDWSSTIEEVHETETGYWVSGNITVNMDGVKITRSSIGTADKHKGTNSEEVAKAAAMDMIKKAASSLGFNGDVYRGEV